MADLDPPGAMTMSEIACRAREIDDLVHHLSCGRVSGEPLSVPAKELRERSDVPWRGPNAAFFGDEAGPGREDRANGSPCLGGGGAYRVGGGALSGAIANHA
ncbi:hypothetical protein [Actinomadura viridis]|uniref:Uncharacterized protein n=1 Tax=Actinomadura viridis TaxID=58110 RepID=A0A931DEV7_9ACTN|nr:hypothetical protein [Actinomadura viridis]MBG6088810.1 hypothetical protein [Actinomadura viridis]